MQAVVQTQLQRYWQEAGINVHTGSLGYVLEPTPAADLRFDCVAAQEAGRRRDEAFSRFVAMIFFVKVAILKVTENLASSIRL